MRRAAKVDANQPAIVAGLRKVGYLVQSLAALGDGVADLLVYDKIVKRFTLLEVKDGDKIPSRRKLRKTQEDWIAKGWPVVKVETLDEALAACDPHPARHVPR